MAELLKTAIDYLHDQLKSHNSVTVLYRRAAATVSVSAVIGRTLFDNEDDFNVVSETAKDFIIHQADLILSGSATSPAKGDEIDETRGSVVYTYAVLEEEGRPPFEDADPYHKAFRVHTKLINVA
jgi:hypothetical protein